MHSTRAHASPPWLSCLFAELLTGGRVLFPGNSTDLDQLTKIYEVRFHHIVYYEDTGGEAPGEVRTLFVWLICVSRYRLSLQKCGTPSERVWKGVSKLKLFNEFPPKHPIQRNLRAQFPSPKYVRVLHDIVLLTWVPLYAGGPTFIYLFCLTLLRLPWLRYNAEAVDLLDKLLTLDPNERLSASKALDHDYFYNDNPPIMRSVDHPKYSGNFHELDFKRQKKNKRKAEQQQRVQQGQQKRPRKAEIPPPGSQQGRGGAPGHHQ